MSTAQPLDSVARRARLGFRHVLQGHPRGLAVLFFSEMWERFSFYGMRALLILYMTDQLLLPGSVEGVWGFAGLRSVLESVFGPLSIQAMSSQIYGLYTGLLYVTPVFGGLLADRMLGQRRTVVLGALLMAAGHFLMAFGATFLLALLLIIAGNGCFKPNVSAQVGALYAPDDVKAAGSGGCRDTDHRQHRRARFPVALVILHGAAACQQKVDSLRRVHRAAAA